jgi:hypothetical protein
MFAVPRKAFTNSPTLTKILRAATEGVGFYRHLRPFLLRLRRVRESVRHTPESPQIRCFRPPGTPPGSFPCCQANRVMKRRAMAPRRVDINPAGQWIIYAACAPSTGGWTEGCRHGGSCRVPRLPKASDSPHGRVRPTRSFAPYRSGQNQSRANIPLPSRLMPALA